MVFRGHCRCVDVSGTGGGLYEKSDSIYSEGCGSRICGCVFFRQYLVYMLLVSMFYVFYVFRFSGHINSNLYDGLLVVLGIGEFWVQFNYIVFLLPRTRGGQSWAYGIACTIQPYIRRYIAIPVVANIRRRNAIANHNRRIQIQSLLSKDYLPIPDIVTIIDHYSDR